MLNSPFLSFAAFFVCASVIQTYSPTSFYLNLQIFTCAVMNRVYVEKKYITHFPVSPAFRVFYAGSRQGHMPEFLSLIHSKKYTPITSVMALVGFARSIIAFS